MLDTIAKALREKRFAAGAINFDRYEVKFEIDEKGKPISVYFKESKDANKLVEEFMLLANRTVAEKVGRVPKNKKAKVLPYRIHDLPDPEKLAQMADANGRPAEPLRKAAAGILVCGDLDRAFRFAKDYWVIDGAIAAQNICLAAQELGLGAVWLGTWPQMDRVEAQKKLFALPETIVPHSIIALGYPEADITAPRASRYGADRVHFNQW